MVLICTHYFQSLFSSSSFGVGGGEGRQGLAVACDRGTPWTFLLTILEVINNTTESFLTGICLLDYETVIEALTW